MIIDRTWIKRDNRYVISYIDKDGKRAFYQKYLSHWPTYEYDDNGLLDTWNGKKCNKVFKDANSYTPNEFDELEFMYKLPKELLDELKASRTGRLYTFDIENEFVPGEKPDPIAARHKITSISLVGPDLSVIVFALKNMGQDSQELFKKRYLSFIESNEYATHLMNVNKWKPKVLYQYFATEEELLKHWFTIIMPKIGMLAGWNSQRYDYCYLVNRIMNVFGKGIAYSMIRKASPTGELTYVSWEELDGTRIRVPAPSHMAIIDYMELVKQYDYILRPYESYSLDWVGEHAVKANKVKYSGTAKNLQELYEKDPEWYFYYNAVDSLIVQLIHYRLKCLQAPCAVSSITLVPLLRATGQIALTTANIFYEFYNDNKHVVWNYDEIDRVKIPYEGAFCGAVPGLWLYTVCDDFKSLYPTQVRTCNLSFENVHKKIMGPDSLGRYTEVPWTNPELEEFKKDPKYFVSVNGTVYHNDRDYAFRKMQTRFMNYREKFKYTGQRLDSELLVEIDRLIKEKKENTKGTN